MKKQSLIALLPAIALLSAGCVNSEAGSQAESSAESSLSAESGTAAGTAAASTTEYFSDRDFEVGYDESESARITLSGESASCDSDAVAISGSTVTITDEGSYILSGTLDDGMVIVDAEKTDKVHLILDGVTIHSETSAPLYILQADKVFVTTAADSENILSNGGTFTAIDENSIDAVIFSKEDLTLNGSGALTITSPAGHGIVSKDSLKITSGSYDISCASHALSGKDDVCIANASFTIVSGKDGIHAENTDDAELGFVYIQSGDFAISSEGDGISAASYLQIEDGTFAITAGGGSVNGEEHASEFRGSFMGGGRQQGGRGGFAGMPGAGTGGEAPAEMPEDMPEGGRGGGFTGEAPDGMPAGMPENMPETGTEGALPTDTAETADSSSDSTSMKGIKAGGELVVNGGTFTIDSADDAVHSNVSLTVNGGTFAIATGDDAFHADDTLTVTGGTIGISESYEGLEGLHVVISGGGITLTASDDGINAAGGNDQSGAGGRDGMFGGGMAASSGGSVLISGGTIHVTASGDGIDANGTLEITGGSITICGPAQGDTATLDYDLSAVISGGTFIGTGSSGMAQNFSSAEQGVIAVQVGNQEAGAEVTLTDGDGNTVLTLTPSLSYTLVILSSPELGSGETYTLTAGSYSGVCTAG